MKTEVFNLKTELSSLKTAATVSDFKILSLEAADTASQSEVSSLKTAATVSDLRILSLETEVSSLESELSSMKTADTDSKMENALRLVIQDLNGLYRLQENAKFDKVSLSKLRTQRNDIAHFILADTKNFRQCNYSVEKYDGSQSRDADSKSILSAKLIIVKKFLIETEFPDKVINLFGKSFIENIKDFMIETIDDKKLLSFVNDNDLDDINYDFSIFFKFPKFKNPFLKS